MIDVGTGDGRFVSTLAKANPTRFYIGVDANRSALAKPSMRATRKPAKGGLANVMYVQAAVEDLPGELDGVATAIHINFPWGSLLQAVINGDMQILSSLRRIAAKDCLLEIVVGLDVVRDQSEIARLALPQFTADYICKTLVPKYCDAGFHLLEHGELSKREWSKLDTSWSKRLQSNDGRRITVMRFRAV